MTVRRVRFAPACPIAPPSGYISEARFVLYGMIGPGPHACHWCGKRVDWQVGRRGNVGLVADHADGDELNDDKRNLVPSCGSCNGTRGRMVREGEPHRVRPNGSRLRGEEQLCGYCEQPYVAVGASRFCSRSCARLADWARRRQVR